MLILLGFVVGALAGSFGGAFVASRLMRDVRRAWLGELTALAKGARAAGVPALPMPARVPCGVPECKGFAAPNCTAKSCARHCSEFCLFSAPHRRTA